MELEFHSRNSSSTWKFSRNSSSLLKLYFKQIKFQNKGISLDSFKKVAFCWNFWAKGVYPHFGPLMRTLPLFKYPHLTHISPNKTLRSPTLMKCLEEGSFVWNLATTMFRERLIKIYFYVKRMHTLFEF